MPAFRSGKPHCHLELSASYNQAAGNHTVLWDLVDEDPIGQSVGAGLVLVERSGVYTLSFGLARPALAL